MSADLFLVASSTLACMRSVRRWLIWQSVLKPGKSKAGKVPFYVDGTPRGITDTPTDAARLATYEEANNAIALRGDGWGLGFALGRGQDGMFWQGIDLDNTCENRLSDLVNRLPGYVEKSPSGNGVHAIGYGRHFRSLGSNSSGMEAYPGGRFFTVTENVVRDVEIVCLAEYVETVLAPRHKALTSVESPAAKAAAFVQIPAQTVADLRSALNFLRSDDYSVWIEIGHALKSLGDIGRGLWLDWSATSPKYEPQEAARKWDSFDPQHTGFQAVFAKAQAQGWKNASSNAVIFAKFADEKSPAEVATIVATPFVMPDFIQIPPRPWILGHWLLRGTVTTVIAPGGTGKSALMVAMALSLATGRQLVGKTVWSRPQRTWLWNLEDDRDELTRQVAACALHYRISEREYSGRLFLNDATSSLCTATKGREGLEIHEPVHAALVAEIRAQQIDVLIVDPFVSSHRAEENDNGQIDTIAKRWASIARQTNCAVGLVHHSRKLAGQRVDAEAARGASALGNAARSVLVLNAMDKTDATRFGIRDDDRHNYFGVSNDKSNRAPAGKSDWYRRVPVLLGNGGPHGGDSVVVIEGWTPPDMAAVYDVAVRTKIQAEIASGEWRAYATAADWAGKVVANVISVDIAVPDEKKRVAALLKDMLTKGQLRVEQRKDASRHNRPFVVVGVSAGDDPPQW